MEEVYFFFFPLCKPVPPVKTEILICLFPKPLSNMPVYFFSWGVFSLSCISKMSFIINLTLVFPSLAFTSSKMAQWKAPPKGGPDTLLLRISFSLLLSASCYRRLRSGGYGPKAQKPVSFSLPDQLLLEAKDSGTHHTLALKQAAISTEAAKSEWQHTNRQMVTLWMDLFPNTEWPQQSL